MNVFEQAGMNNIGRRVMVKRTPKVLYHETAVIQAAINNLLFHKKHINGISIAKESGVKPTYVYQNPIVRPYVLKYIKHEKKEHLEQNTHPLANDIQDSMDSYQRHVIDQEMRYDLAHLEKQRQASMPALLTDKELDELQNDKQHVQYLEHINKNGVDEPVVKIKTDTPYLLVVDGKVMGAIETTESKLDKDVAKIFANHWQVDAKVVVYRAVKKVSAKVTAIFKDIDE